jgi:uncharacterized damage-inducible protein DinB
MSQIAAFQKELEKEADITRKMFSVVPDDQYDWKPHQKSMTIKVLVTHIADIFTWFGMALNSSELDFAINPYQPESPANTKELLNLFEKNLVESRTALANGKEDQLNNIWTLRNGEEIYVKDPKSEVIRMCFSQIIHHRAQLGVYLRLLNIPIPGSYGPSADEIGL